MKLALIFRFYHLVLTPFMVLGWWIFPRLGISGEAITVVSAHGLGLILALWVLFSGRTRLQLNLSNFRLDPNIIWRIVRVGIPASIMGVQRNIGHLVLVRFMAPFGTLAVAAHSLVNRIELVFSPPNTGLAMAAGVLVGQNLGAGRPERAEKNGWFAVGLSEGCMLISSVAILLWAESIVRVFTTEPSLVETASLFLRIAAAGYLVLGFETILQQSISGAGDTLPPMIVSLTVLWLVMLPLAFFLPRVSALGVYGIRWAMVAGPVVGAVVYTTYFRLGMWKRKKV